MADAAKTIIAAESAWLERFDKWVAEVRDTPKRMPERIISASHYKTAIEHLEAGRVEEARLILWHIPLGELEQISYEMRMRRAGLVTP